MRKKKKKTSQRKKASEKTAPNASASDDYVDVEGEVIEEDLSDFNLEVGDSASSAMTPTDPMSRYMSELSKYPVLSREDEQKLAIRYKETGDPKAAEALVTANLRFVVKVAAEYTKFGAKLIDLVQEGNVGLMHAVKEFNPYKGVRLITYAVWWIRGYIQEYLMRQYSMVRIGTTANQRKLFYQLQKEREQLERMGYQEGIALLSGKLGIPEEEIETMHQRLTGRDVSLDQPTGSSESSSTLMDFQTEDTDESLVDLLGNAEEIALLKDKIEDVRKELNDRELELLDQRILSDNPITLQEIGEKHGVSREAVRQMEARVIKKIKDSLLESL